MKLHPIKSADEMWKETKDRLKAWERDQHRPGHIWFYIACAAILGSFIYGLYQLGQEPTTSGGGGTPIVDTHSD